MMFLPPAFKVLTRVHLPEVDLAVLDRLVGAMWDGTTREDIECQINCGTLEAYKAADALVLIETVDWPVGRELLIYGMAGSGILKQKDGVVHDLRALAAFKGCRMIGAHGIPEGWSKIGPALGFRPVSTHYVMELDDGR